MAVFDPTRQDVIASEVEGVHVELLGCLIHLEFCGEECLRLTEASECTHRNFVRVSYRSIYLHVGDIVPRRDQAHRLE